jgi:integrase
MPRRTLTDKSIAALKVAKRVTIPDTKIAGLYVRVTPNGAKTFVAVARDPRGKQVWHTIGPCESVNLDDARTEAAKITQAIKKGRDTAGLQSYESVAEDWLKRHVDAKGLITHRGKRRYLDKQILPAWGSRDFTSIKRSDVAKLLDDIEDNSGPAAADAALAVVSSISNWFASRNDDYVSPIVRGMRRTNPKERARKRILSDDELRLVWTQAEANGLFGALVRLLLLTGQRRTTVASMRWEDVSVDGTWSIPNEGRQKGTGKELVLPQIALDIIKAQPRFASSPYVLSGRYAGTHYSNYGHAKATFDSKLPPMPQWGLHDLRRTARSLMSRAGVLPHISERVLGHAQQGVEGIYDRHSYSEEKAHALKALAGLIENILSPPADKVVRIATGTARRGR